MGFEGKLERAKQMAAAFAIMGLLNMERVSIHAIGQPNDRPSMLPPGTGRSRMRAVLSYLEEIECGGDVPIESAIQQMLKFHRGRGIAILLSDFLTLGDLSRSMNLLFSGGLETWGMQILSETERNPLVEGDLRFVDCETQETLDITNVAELLNLYHEHREWQEAELDQQCRRRNGRFLSISSQDSFNSLMFDTLNRKGWVSR